MTRIIIIGSKGRMGQALVACAANFRELEITGQIDKGIAEQIAREEGIVGERTEKCDDRRNLLGGKIKATWPQTPPEGWIGLDT